MPISRLALFMSFTIFASSCSKASKSTEKTTPPGLSSKQEPLRTTVRCEKPGETILTTREQSQNAMDFIRKAGDPSGVTEPSDKPWSIETQSSLHALKVGSEVFAMKFDDAQGKIFLKTSVDAKESLGELFLMRYTNPTAHDSSHCSTFQFRFTVKVGTVEEKGTYAAPIY